MRKCGPCAVCCKVFHIEELNKPAGVPCFNLHKQGYRCTIYEDRPQACSEYFCAWARGAGAAVNHKDRPDTCGVIVDRRSTQFGVILVARSVTPNAAMAPKGKKAIERITRDEGLPLVVINDDEFIIAAAGPPDFMEVVARKGPRLGDKKDWITNIFAYAQEDRVFPGLDHGG